MDELASVAYSSLEQRGDGLEDSSIAASSELELNESNTSASEAISEATTEEASEQVSNTSNIDIVSLQNVNPDIFAWINVPGTLIDYPIVQHPTDDTYYLSHGPEGMNSSHGCPFIESCDSISLQDFNTVVYGHNMNDGSMFAGLHKFEDKDFLENHREITINTADHEMSYRIFAAVMYSDAYIPYYYDDSVDADRLAFLDSLSTDCVSSRSIILDDEKVGADDHIITLSTCDRKLRDNRYIVVAVLKKIDGVDV